MNRTPETPSHGGRRPLYRVALVSLGLLAGLVVAEFALLVTGAPRFYEPHQNPPQFGFFPSRFGDGRDQRTGAWVYVNRPSHRIRFEYDGDPRGYFDAGNAIEHRTNALGFRGPEFSLWIEGGIVATQKSAGMFRLVFLGDSFTFGEGVRFADTYPEVTASLLRKNERRPSSRRVESYNFGVGGHNTTQSRYILETLGVGARPDVVVLGYVLNDAEAPLFDLRQGEDTPARRDRVIEEMASHAPPESLVYRLRTVRTLWRSWRSWKLSRYTETYYQSLYTDANDGWLESRRSLQQIIRICEAREIPCLVVLFPVLHRLDDTYPFIEIHEKIRKQAESAGASFIDLFPALKGRDVRELWVHPSDHHPNEHVHALAGEAIYQELTRKGIFFGDR